MRNLFGRIEFKQVTKFYKRGLANVPAIEDVSFAVEPGEFCSILGPSGCGKTTIINLAAGYVEPTNGEVIFDMRSVSGPSRERVVVSQGYDLYDWKTVRGNVEFGLKARGVSREVRREIVDSYLDLVNLHDVADLYPFELSGGMRQRVALTRALAVEPLCLLMDEPLAALDLELKYFLQEELLNIWTRSRQTVIYVTHDWDEAVFLSDKILIMTSSPGQVDAVVNVPFSRPRSKELRFCSDFQKVRRDIVKGFSVEHDR